MEYWQQKITVLNDSYDFLTHLPEEGVVDLLKEKFRPDPPKLTTHVFLIESTEHAPVLIDTGMGDRMAPMIEGHLLKALEFIGVKPEEIGVILLTHLHGDHFYGLTDKTGRKMFPNAAVWISEAEQNFWLRNNSLTGEDLQNSKDAGEALASYELLPVGSGSILPGISPVALPGHTPGQTGFLVESEGERILFCADLLTLPAIQTSLPDVGFSTDVDYTLAVQTRRDTLERAAKESLLLAGPHFEFPCLTYVQKKGDGYQLIPKQWF
ncbi:MBL fold metallo-hydrolase [Chitinophaga pinensis]|uniref:MBL fold metallo-hydrolase n=1 Tax=Chitinophaga pinensis TaxID=79329 RepID=A0A5C6LNY8_9BACT|nr:MBL fold metallo-hydrolase [Chitinophaga pinensis]TWV99010.1 MBL fold metallo-hydrolase [Chitinophaga pinensis]